MEDLNMGIEDIAGGANPLLRYSRILTHMTTGYFYRKSVQPVNAKWPDFGSDLSRQKEALAVVAEIKYLGRDAEASPLDVGNIAGLENFV